jgi:hypothetical protein
LAIAIVASNRNNQFYLTQTIAYLIEEMAEQIRAKQWALVVCFVEEETNEEVQKLQKISFNFLFVFQKLTFSLANTQDQRVIKENHDYWTCLNRTYHLIPSAYVLMLEDDALAIPEAATQIQSLIDQLSGNERQQSVDYVKLFHPWYLRKLPSYIQVGVFNSFK